jgi:hypothetical protein
VANNGYSMGAHTTDTDTQLTETQVDGFVANNGYSVGAHTTGLDWSAISNIPSDIADGDQDTQLTTVPWNMVTGAPDHVDLAGDTMTGALNLPADGLSVGSSQLSLSGGNVGVGIASPQAPLHVAGMMVQGTSRGTLSSQVASYFTNQATSDYIHIRLPFDPTQAANMFHIKVTGYAYGGSTKVIDITYVGYAYTGTGTIINTEILNPNGGHAPAIYQGSDNNVYLRFRPSTTYYLSFRADSMYVGNGRIIEPGEVTVIRSSASNL